MPRACTSHNSPHHIPILRPARLSTQSLPHGGPSQRFFSQHNPHPGSDELFEQATIGGSSGLTTKRIKPKSPHKVHQLKFTRQHKQDAPHENPSQQQHHSSVDPPSTHQHNSSSQPPQTHPTSPTTSPPQDDVLTMIPHEISAPFTVRAVIPTNSITLLETPPASLFHPAPQPFVIRSTLQQPLHQSHTIPTAGDMLKYPPGAGANTTDNILSRLAPHASRASLKKGSSQKPAMKKQSLNGSSHIEPDPTSMLNEQILANMPPPSRSPGYLSTTDSFLGNHAFTQRLKEIDWTPLRDAFSFTTVKSTPVPSTSRPLLSFSNVFKAVLFGGAGYLLYRWRIPQRLYNTFTVDRTADYPFIVRNISGEPEKKMEDIIEYARIRDHDLPILRQRYDRISAYFKTIDEKATHYHNQLAAFQQKHPDYQQTQSFLKFSDTLGRFLLRFHIIAYPADYASLQSVQDFSTIHFYTKYDLFTPELTDMALEEAKKADNKLISLILSSDELMADLKQFDRRIESMTEALIATDQSLTKEKEQQRRLAHLAEAERKELQQQRSQQVQTEIRNRVAKQLNEEFLPIIDKRAFKSIDELIEAGLADEYKAFDVDYFREEARRNAPPAETAAAKIFMSSQTHTFSPHEEEYIRQEVDAILETKRQQLRGVQFPTVYRHDDQFGKSIYEVVHQPPKPASKIEPINKRLQEMGIYAPVSLETDHDEIGGTETQQDDQPDPPITTSQISRAAAPTDPAPAPSQPSTQQSTAPPQAPTPSPTDTTSTSTKPNRKTSKQQHRSAESSSSPRKPSTQKNTTNPPKSTTKPKTIYIPLERNKTPHSIRGFDLQHEIEKLHQQEQKQEEQKKSRNVKE